MARIYAFLGDIPPKNIYSCHKIFGGGYFMARIYVLGGYPPLEYFVMGQGGHRIIFFGRFEKKSGVKNFFYFNCLI